MNFVCIVFKQYIKMLTLSSMENLIMECNLVGYQHIHKIWMSLNFGQIPSLTME